MKNLTRRKFLALTTLTMMTTVAGSYLVLNKESASLLPTKIKIQEISNKSLRESIISYQERYPNTSREEALANGFSFWHGNKLYSFWDVIS